MGNRTDDIRERRESEGCVVTSLLRTWRGSDEAWSVQPKQRSPHVGGGNEPDPAQAEHTAPFEALQDCRGDETLEVPTNRGMSKHIRGSGRLESATIEKPTQNAGRRGCRRHPGARV